MALVSPSSLSFADAAVGRASSIKYVTIPNAGNANLSFSSAMGMTGNCDFAGTGTYAIGTPVAPGKSCTVSTGKSVKRSLMIAGMMARDDNRGDGGCDPGCDGAGVAPR